MIRRTSTILSVTQRFTYSKSSQDLFARAEELVLQQIKQDEVDLEAGIDFNVRAATDASIEQEIKDDEDVFEEE